VHPVSGAPDLHERSYDSVYFKQQTASNNTRFMAHSQKHLAEEADPRKNSLKHIGEAGMQKDGLNQMKRQSLSIANLVKRNSLQQPVDASGQTSSVESETMLKARDCGAEESYADQNLLVDSFDLVKQDILANNKKSKNTPVRHAPQNVFRGKSPILAS